MVSAILEIVSGEGGICSRGVVTNGIARNAALRRKVSEASVEPPSVACIVSEMCDSGRLVGKRVRGEDVLSLPGVAPKQRKEEGCVVPLRVVEEAEQPPAVSEPVVAAAAAEVAPPTTLSEMEQQVMNVVEGQGGSCDNGLIGARLGASSGAYDAVQRLLDAGLLVATRVGPKRNVVLVLPSLGASAVPQPPPTDLSEVTPLVLKVVTARGGSCEFDRLCKKLKKMTADKRAKPNVVRRAIQALVEEGQLITRNVDGTSGRNVGWDTVVSLVEKEPGDLRNSAASSTETTVHEEQPQQQQQRVVLHHNGRPSGPLKYGKNLPLAAAEGRLEAVKAMLASGVDVERKDHFGFTALLWAAKNGHLAVVEELLSAKANVHACQPVSRSTAVDYALDTAVLGDSDCAIARVLLNAGAAPVTFKLPAKAGRNSYKAFQEVRSLLKEFSQQQPKPLPKVKAKGVAVRPAAKMAPLTEAGLTPLMVAVENGSEEAVRSCLAGGKKKGGDLNAMCQKGHTALDYALFNTAKGPVLEVHLAIALLLIRAGGRVSNFSDVGWAVTLGNAELVKQLIARRADLTLRDNQGHSPLDLAKARNRADLVALLVAAGVQDTQAESGRALKIVDPKTNGTVSLSPKKAVAQSEGPSRPQQLSFVDPVTGEQIAPKRKLSVAASSAAAAPVAAAKSTAATRLVIVDPQTGAPVDVSRK